MYIVDTKNITIRNFYEGALKACVHTNYFAIISVIARSYDGKVLQDELINSWRSLDDITGTRILIAVPYNYSNTHESLIKRVSSSGGVQMIANGIRVDRPYDDNWVDEFWNQSGKYAKSIDNHHSEIRNSITSKTSETAEYFGLSEKHLPCIVIQSIWEKEIVIINSENPISIYPIIKNILISLDDKIQEQQDQRIQIDKAKNEIISLLYDIEKLKLVNKRILDSNKLQKPSLLRHLNMDLPELRSEKTKEIIEIIKNDKKDSIETLDKYLEFLERQPVNYILLRILDKLRRYKNLLKTNYINNLVLKNTKIIEAKNNQISDNKELISQLKEKLKTTPKMVSAIREALSYVGIFEKNYSFSVINGMGYWKKTFFTKNQEQNISKIQGESLLSIVQSVIQLFRNIVENNGGFKVCYDDKKNLRHESIPQKLFHSIAKSYIEGKEYYVDISPESDAGRGPVDFKFSQGKCKINVELKYSANPKLIAGYKYQIREYNKAEGTMFSIYLVLAQTKDKNAINKLLQLEKKQKLSSQHVPIVEIVNLNYKKSASRISDSV